MRKLSFPISQLSLFFLMPLSHPHNPTLLFTNHTFIDDTPCVERVPFKVWMSHSLFDMWMGPFVRFPSIPNVDGQFTLFFYDGVLSPWRIKIKQAYIEYSFLSVILWCGRLVWIAFSDFVRAMCADWVPF